MEENNNLKEELLQLKLNSANWELSALATFELEKKNFSGSSENIIAELVKQSEIIPYEGVLCGDVLLREKGAKVFSHEWIFAQFDDGHISGYLLIHYSIVGGEPGNWKVIDSYLFGEEE